MFDTDVSPAAALGPLLAQLRRLAVTEDLQSGLDVIALLEAVKGAAAAAQVVQTAAYRQARHRESDQRAGVTDEPTARYRRERVDAGIAAEVGRARRCSTWQARWYLTATQLLTRDLPLTLSSLRAGATTEHRAMIVVRETGWLAAADRSEVDDLLAGRLSGLGDRGTEAEARRCAYRVDPHGARERTRQAEADRRVTLRPAPDCMARLSALVPMAQGIAAYAALRKAAGTAQAAGDPRTQGQVMADTLIERVTGQAHAGEVPVTVNLTLPLSSLLNTGPDGDEPGDIDGYGPVPAHAARDLATPAGHVPVWIRRLFTGPDGHLVTMETRRRQFTASQRDYVRLRDRTCHTPYCEAEIRHIDHRHRHTDGGPTSLDNAQGLCEACNYSKDHTRYHARDPAA